MEKATTLGKVLILLAHPDFQNSVANKALFEAVRNLPGVNVIDLYTAPFETKAYHQLLNEARALVFQFPFYWASAPAQLKKWCDEIFTPLAQTSAVTGKPLLVATTTGSEYTAYRSGGRNSFTIDELLRPYQLLANHSGMLWQTPLVVYGVALSDSAESIQKGAKAYSERIKDLLNK